MHPDDDEHVLEVGPDAAGREGPRPGLLEDDGHDVVPDVPLPQELRSGRGGEDRCGYRRGLRSPLVPESTGPSLQLAPPGVAQDEPAGGLQGPGEEGLKA